MSEKDESKILRSKVEELLTELPLAELKKFLEYLEKLLASQGAPKA